MPSRPPGRCPSSPPVTRRPAPCRGIRWPRCWEFPARVRRGRPRRLLGRAVIAAALSLVVLQLIPGTASAPADVAGLIVWFVLTARRDLAPPPER